MNIKTMEKILGTTDLNDLFKMTLDDPELRLKVFQLVVDNSIWVDPAIYKRIQVVFPRTVRRSGKQKRGDVDSGNTIWNNEPAKWAFWNAMGLNYSGLKNSYICHIYEGSVSKPEHFTNLANMVAFPRAIQSLSEWHPINEILKYRSYKLYNYIGPDNQIPVKPDQYDRFVFRTIDLSDDDKGRIIERLLKAKDTKPWYGNGNTLNKNE